MRARRAKRSAVRRTRPAVASPIEFRRSSHFVTPRRRSSLLVELDDLRVDRRIRGADRLDRELVVLPGSGRGPARRSGTSARSCTPSRAVVRGACPVLDVGAADRCRAFGPKGRGRSLRSAKLYISLFTTSDAAPDVRSNRPVSSKPGVWMRRHPERGQLLHRADEVPPRCIVRQDVVRPARGLELLRHFGALCAQLDSMRALLDHFPPETVVRPGHGPATTLGRELETNPFLSELRAERPK